MKKQVKEPYIAFDPEQATFLFDRHFKLESRDEILPKIAKMIHHMFLPKKRFLCLGGSIVAFILVVLITATFGLPMKMMTSVAFIIMLFGIGMVFSLISHYIAVFTEIRRLKKLYKNAQWPCESYCAFYEEGFYYKAMDMEGVFYWEDFMCIMVTHEVLSFNFCPAETPKGKEMKKFYPRLDTFYMFIHGDRQILELMIILSQQIGDLVEFR
ncbi:hypothetical protein [Gilliamella sp. B2838]|uniref:hypothetical protein n=1 Tax=Gilliamella sp. B2838 TaxID=2818020 RepID=UPI00226A4999|nr:hypothetical protein [Gilliamella sp. B2838]MCX8727426.1 hypothetical protein [Gilliamella sp. B2838]